MLAVTITLLVQILHSPAQQQPDAQATTTSQQKTSQPVTTGKIHVAQTEPNCGTEKGQKTCQQPAWREWLAVGNNWIVLCTVILATAALAQLELTRRTAQRQLRAYVFVDEKGAKLRGENTVVVFGTVKNMGQTPAYEMRSNRIAKISKSPRANYSEPLNDEPWLVHKILVLTGRYAGTVANLGPGSSVPFEIEVALTADQFVSLMANNSAVWLVGRLRYKDIFGKSRYTRYCYYIMGKGLKTHGQLHGSAKGNKSK